MWILSREGGDASGDGVVGHVVPEPIARQHHESGLQLLAVFTAIARGSSGS